MWTGASSLLLFAPSCEGRKESSAPGQLSLSCQTLDTSVCRSWARQERGLSSGVLANIEHQLSKKQASFIINVIGVKDV